MARIDETPIVIDDTTSTQKLSGKELERELYRSADNSEYYRQVSSVLFWVATSLAAIAFGGVFLGGEAFTTVAGSLGMGKWGLATSLGAVSAATQVANVSFARAAAKERESNDMQYSVRQAEDMADSLVEKLEGKAKERQQIKSAEYNPHSSPFERHYLIDEPHAKGGVTVRGDREPGHSWVEATGHTHSKGAHQQWAEYVQATQQVALARE